MSRKREWKKTHKGKSKEEIEKCTCDLCMGTNLPKHRGIHKTEKQEEGAPAGV